MADIAFGIIGTVAITIHSARRVKQFMDSIESAPTFVRRLSADVDALTNVLEVLDVEFKSKYFTSSSRYVQIIQLLDQPLQNCLVVLNLLSDEIRRYVKSGGSQGKNKWKPFRWSNREKEFLALEKLLLSYKSSLDIAISATNLTSTTSGLGEIHTQLRQLQRRIDDDNASIADSSFQGSSAVLTDYGFTLKRFLCEASSMLEDPPSHNDDLFDETEQPEKPNTSEKSNTSQNSNVRVEELEADTELTDASVKKVAVFRPNITLHPGSLSEAQSVVRDGQQVSTQERWAQIRKNAAARAAARAARESDEDSGEETIESRVARIKARVAELTGNIEAARR